MSTSDHRTAPFEYTFQFALTGIRDTTLEQSIRVSVEAPFVAASIGYGVVPLPPTPFGPDRERDFFNNPAVATGGAAGTAGIGGAISGRIPPPPTQPATPRRLPQVGLGAVFNALQRQPRVAVVPPVPGPRRRTIAPPTAWADLFDVLRHGIELTPEAIGVLEAGGDQRVLAAPLLGRLFRPVQRAPGEVQFLYSIIDDTSGRVFSNAPLLSTSALGSANGERPFRHFAVPITFAPRATIRIVITELVTSASDLHITLQGYRELGGVPATGQRGGGARGRRGRRT